MRVRAEVVGQEGSAQEVLLDAGPERFFPESFLSKPLADDAELDADSANLVTQLKNMAGGLGPLGQTKADGTPLVTKANLATYDFAPSLYIVPIQQPRVHVGLVATNTNVDLRRAFADGVPIPPNAQPSIGTDGQMLIWQPSTDTMWEFWNMKPDAAGNWTAGYGGRIENVSTSPGYYRDIPELVGGGLEEQHSWGGPSCSIPHLPGLITVPQLRSGTIGHGLTFACKWNMAGQWVFPAQRTDGNGLLGTQVMQGMRFRLPASYVSPANAHPGVRMLSEAIRDYGCVVNNTTSSGVLFYAEDQRNWPSDANGGVYYGPDGLLGPRATNNYATVWLRQMPWSQMQALRRGTTWTNRNAPTPKPAWWT